MAGPEQQITRFVTRTGLWWEMLPPRPLELPAEVTAGQAILYASARYMRGLVFPGPPPPYSVPPGDDT